MEPKQTLSLPDGTQATLIVSDRLTAERIAILEDVLPGFLRAMRQQAQFASDAGAIEYDSWPRAF